MSATLMLLADVLVAGLLVACMVTCARLGRRIARLQADEASMRRTIGELVSATENAERAIAGLRNTLGECDRTLGERLRVAERYAADLASQVEAGESVMGRIMQAVDASRRAVAAEREPAPRPAPRPAPVPSAARPEPVAPPPPRREPPPPETPAVSQRISAAAELIAERAVRRLSTARGGA